MPDLFIGLMSGTSLDGVDGVLADFSSTAAPVVASSSIAMPVELRTELLALNTSGIDELHRAALAGNALMRVYAQVVHEVLLNAGMQIASVRAIGAHGQTVRHRPQQFDGTGYTLQLCQPALLAELTGIDVVADFRSRDVAAGGQGAPLAPFFHRAFFGHGSDAVGILNIGGMSNLTLLRTDGSMLGFDCGPGNVLMDVWCSRYLDQAFDADGAWAAAGNAIPELLKRLLSEPYFCSPPPKSTGRDRFNFAWLESHLQASADARPADVQATLAELTARTCADEVLRHEPALRRLIVCGGGALNAFLMQRLQRLLPTAHVMSSADCGLPPLQVEATAFAWLARKTVNREKLDLTSTTGARGARVLGAVYPA